MFQKTAYQEKIIAFVMDEAHCIRIWQAVIVSNFDSNCLISGVMYFEKHFQTLVIYEAYSIALSMLWF